MKTILYKVTISAGGCEMVRGKVLPMECDETPKAYKWPGYLIKKTLVMIPDSIMRNENPGTLHYFIWCLEPQIEQAKQILYDKCMDKLIVFEDQVKKLRQSLTKSK